MLMEMGCDADETAGCTDPTACNGSFFTDTDNSLCVYADEVCEVCLGGAVVLFDLDGDGVCNADEIAELHQRCGVQLQS